MCVYVNLFSVNLLGQLVSIHGKSVGALAGQPC